MPYRVFFVEDEVVIREGMRDRVDWAAHGFQYCGDAPDGEMALPLLQALKPDLLITDIRMPFMDGLQLSQVVRERFPGTKIIILSGHDEFEYAQQAIKIGVFEYLLKPVSRKDLQEALSRARSALEQEEQERLALQRLEEQVELNRSALRDRLLLRLVTGAATSAETMVKSALLDLDLVARCYLVVAIKLEPADDLAQFGYLEYQNIQQSIAELVGNNPDVFLLRKDMDELVLVLKGNSPENVLEERSLIVDRARQAIKHRRCEMIVGTGTPENRLSEISRSFTAATQNMHDVVDWRFGALGFEKENLLRVSRSPIEDCLRVGTAEDIDAAFDAFVRPLGERPLQSAVIRGFVFTDIVLAAARFVDELGSDPAEVIPELQELAAGAFDIQSTQQLRGKVHTALLGALSFRDSRMLDRYAEVLHQAQEYINRHYMSADLSLSSVATHVNLSACHFSAIFSQETGRTFKSYVTETRIRKAQELIRTTAMKASEIGYQVGYNDPHYFSHVFRKVTGLTPTEFRAQVQNQ